MNVVPNVMQQEHEARGKVGKWGRKRERWKEEHDYKILVLLPSQWCRKHFLLAVNHMFWQFPGSSMVVFFSLSTFKSICRKQAYEASLK